MIHTVRSIIRPKSPLYRFLLDNARGTRAVRNTANFLIRNTLTALSKSPGERTQNENEVLARVERGAEAVGIARENAFLSAVKKGRKSGGLRAEASIYKKLQSILHPITIPEPGRALLSYELIDGILKFEKDPAYLSCVSHVSQQAIRKTVSSWKSYFSALKDWKKHPEKYRAMPRFPGYIRRETSTAHFTNQVCSYTGNEQKGTLVFLKHGSVPFAGTGLMSGKLVKVESKPRGGVFLLLATLEDDREIPGTPEHPERAMGIDPGLGNFMTCVTNTGAAPLILRGGWIKSVNRWYNKEKARLTSCLTRGEDSQHSKKHSRALDILSRRRETRIREYFYKAAHRICRLCVREGVTVIVCGHNEGQKDGVCLGHVNNQSFVTIPYADFFAKLAHVAAGYGIAVVLREESYTSAASLPDMDSIPVYGNKNGKEPVFSGKRRKRGLYVSSDGTKLNADVNAAANILRKEYPYIFEKTDLASLYGTVTALRAEEILGIRMENNGNRRTTKGAGRPRYHRNLKSRRKETEHRTRAMLHKQLSPVAPA